jgi:hypothetical protein
MFYLEDCRLPINLQTPSLEAKEKHKANFNQGFLFSTAKLFYFGHRSPGSEAIS